MTWSARITRPDGTNPIQEGNTAPDCNACQSCRHNQPIPVDGQHYKQINPCYLPKVASSVGNLLTSVDVDARGHMACGEALLKCGGYEAKVKEEEPHH